MATETVTVISRFMEKSAISVVALFVAKKGRAIFSGAVLSPMVALDF